MHATSKTLFFKTEKFFHRKIKVCYLILMTISLQKLEYNNVLSRKMLIEEM